MSAEEPSVETVEPVNHCEQNNCADTVVEDEKKLEEKPEPEIPAETEKKQELLRDQPIVGQRMEKQKIEQ